MQRVNDNEQQQILAQIRKCINEWVDESNALLKVTDRDRFYMFFEHRYLAQYVSKKFDILYKVRKVGEDMKLPVSISIGIGVGGSLSENDMYARNALDMALGRGGDQVSIKDDTQYKFYGSKARDYEKSTRVKTRAIAVALKDFIKNSDKVIFMGHSGADYDCFGAAVGLQRAVRTLGKKPYIVYDNNSPAIKKMYDDLRAMSEYRGMFISNDDAVENVTSDTLIVVLDTHRPSMLPCPKLIEKASKVVLIDHHRRSTDFINPCSLIYHEPYASSTCEMSTELLEYMNLGSSLTTVEAECLYTGILMDTKNFIVKTGVRTFEAAAYLKRNGADLTKVRKMSRESMETYRIRAKAISEAEILYGRFAIATLVGIGVDSPTVIGAQVANELLDIDGIEASFVLTGVHERVYISARSIDEVNVQKIMEEFGGGGHLTVAGAQLVDVSLEEAKNIIHETLRYLISKGEI